MDKMVLAGASYSKQKYFFEPAFSEMPEAIQAEIREVSIFTAENVRGLFLIGFYTDGSVFMEAAPEEETSLEYDEIGVHLEMEELKREKKELLRSLSLWYVVFKTKEGEKLRESLLENKDKI